MDKNRKKILIIKLGYSETLDREIEKIPSLGDVLRTTVVLNKIKKDFVTWLVDEKAYPLLRDNKHIAKVLIYNTGEFLKIQRQQYDIVINFEKDPEICLFSDSIKSKRHYGFRFDKDEGKIKYYDGSEGAFEICNDIEVKRCNEKYWQQIIMEMVHGEWKQQNYVLGYKPKSKIKYDIGLNWAVGVKWPNKAWPKEYWERLSNLIKGRYTYSWQEGLDGIYDYIEWINSCRLLVTSDSLCQHIALALKKKVIILYGPTHSNETYLYGRGKELLPEVDYKCIPCLKNKCRQEKSCMKFIYPKRVDNEINKILDKNLQKNFNYG